MTFLGQLLQSNLSTSTDGYGSLHSVKNQVQVTGLVIENTTAGILYLQLHDGYTVPSNGVVPVVSFKVPANSQVVFSFDQAPLCFTNGCVHACSSTGPTLTKVATGLFVTLQYL